MDCSMPGVLSPFLLFPRVCSNSCPLSQWCYPAISSPVATFFSCLQSFPASWSFPMCRLFAKVTDVLEFQPQSFQWILRIDSLEDWLVQSPCSPRGSQRVFFIQHHNSEAPFLQCSAFCDEMLHIQLYQNSLSVTLDFRLHCLCINWIWDNMQQKYCFQCLVIKAEEGSYKQTKATYKCFRPFRKY